MQILIGVGIGIISIILLIPLIQNIQDCLYALCQTLISWLNVRITYNNAQAQEIQAQFEQQNVNAVGFETSNEEAYYDDDDEDNKCKMSEKHKLGF